VRSNRITGNAAGVWAWCFDPATCAIQVTLEGNLIDHNSSNGVNSNEYAVLQLRNNTIAHNVGATVRYNDVWGNAQDYVGGAMGEGGLLADPLFRMRPAR